MSLSAFAAPLAQSLIGDAGFVVTFTRDVSASYQPTYNTPAPPVTTTWTGTAIWTRNEHKFAPTVALSEGTGQQVTARALLVSGLSVSLAPQPNDRVTVAGVVYRVDGVFYLGDADGGAVPLYRVDVTR